MKGAPDTHYALFELKVTSPLALSEGGMGTLGGRVGFGNMAKRKTYLQRISVARRSCEEILDKDWIPSSYTEALPSGTAACSALLTSRRRFVIDAS